ncbi:MAG: class I SAM-dependent DNA methyltransferase [Candidatus Vecturithrix sp.]|jgi:type I restriction enzyme M protein|nr:class I SAM-dependent DNA methyltransferase [Candidatus Vecturithrix sp.]
MANESVNVVQKLWNYCNVLRDDGVSYGDYVEQLTYLLFLKMADEQTKPPFNKPALIPADLNWQTLVDKSGDALEVHYRHILQELGKQHGMLGIIFRKAQNRIQDPAKLQRLLTYIDEETWTGLPINIKGDIYEGLLEKNAQDVKSGAGQYFTPRALIKAMVEVMRPAPNMTICDPACGTGGFFIAAHDELITQRLDRAQADFLRFQTFKGWEIVDSAARLCAMNLYLHGIGGEESPILVGDSLRADPGERFDLVLTNPPFGKKSSITVVNEEGKQSKDDSLRYERSDFATTTSNKQLNFVQHVKTILKPTGRAAIVVPDNVLFEGGAGETIRKKLLQTCDVHTLLRLPTGIFYAQGVKANVLFFDSRPASPEPQTKQLWIYDLRTNQNFTLKTNPLRYEHLTDFIRCYNPDNRHRRAETDQFRGFAYDALMQRDKVSLDIFWLKDDSLEDLEHLPTPEIIAQEIAENLQVAFAQFDGIYADLTER